MNAVDTNVLIYAHDPNDPRKRQAALDLIRDIQEGALLWQVACEFLSASRKLTASRAAGLNAAEWLNRLQRNWTLVLPTWNTMEQAQRLVQDCSISVWDALIVAASLESGVTELWSEDIHPHRAFGSLSIVNPFA